MLTSVTLQVYLQRLRGSTVLQYNREHLENKGKKNAINRGEIHKKFFSHFDNNNDAIVSSSKLPKPS